MAKTIKRRRERLSLKAANQQRHAMRRAVERYNLFLQPTGIREIVNMIRRGEGVFLRRTSCNRTVWQVTYHECQLVVVYDKRRKMLASVLPPQRQAGVGEKAKQEI
jgi:hypothetical protein